MKKTNNILYIANGTFPAESANRIQIMNMCEAFSDNKINITLLAFKHPQQFRNPEELFQRFGITNKFTLNFIRPLGNYYIRSFQLFIYFVLKKRKQHKNIFTRDLFIAYLIKTFFPSKKVIYELHQINDNKLRLKLLQTTFKKIDKIIVISLGLKTELKSKGLNEKKIIMLHDGVKIKKISKEHKKYQQKNKIPIVMYTGSLIARKGINTLLDAFLDIPDKIAILKIVGGSQQEVRKLQIKYNKKNIIFTGRKLPKSIPLILQESDILVIPNSGKVKISSHYTSPLKLFEYMISKKPIIASNLPSIKEILNDKTAIFFQADNEKDLRKKILELIKNKQLQKTLSSNAYKLGQKHSRIERTKKINKLYT